MRPIQSASVLLAMSLITPLVGCGENTSGGAGTTSPAVESPSPTTSPAAKKEGDKKTGTAAKTDKKDEGGEGGEGN